MSNEMGTQTGYYEFIIRLVTLVIVVVNAMVTVASVWIWRSFLNFKKDIKEVLREYIQREGQSRLEIKKETEEALNRIHEHDILLVKLENAIEQQRMLCNERRHGK